MRSCLLRASCSSRFCPPWLLSLRHVATLSRRDDNPSGPNPPRAEPIAALVDLDYGPRLGAVNALLGDCLVELGIEPLALGREPLDARPRERCDHVLVDELDARYERGGAVVRWRAV